MTTLRRVVQHQGRWVIWGDSETLWTYHSLNQKQRFKNRASQCVLWDRITLVQPHNLSLIRSAHHEPDKKEIIYWSITLKWVIYQTIVFEKCLNRGWRIRDDSNAWEMRCQYLSRMVFCTFDRITRLWF